MPNLSLNVTEVHSGPGDEEMDGSMHALTA